MTFQKKAMGFLIIASMALLLCAFPPQIAKADTESEQSYKIQDGETLWSVAEKFYGTGFDWTYIASRNNILDSSNIPAGKILFVPPVSSKYAQTKNGELVFAAPAQVTKAVQGASTVSLEEMVYADLATRHYLNNVSVYSYDGNPANTISINSDKQWLPASTVKTFVAMYAYDQIDKGNLNLDDQVLVQAKNVVPTELVTDELPTLNEGEYVTVDRLIRQMITQSDNTAYNVLLDVLDRRSVTDYIHSLGLKNSAVGSKLNLDDSQLQDEQNAPGYGINTTTASDYSLAFRLINDGKIPGAGDLLSVFSQQKINNMIPFYLPKSVRVAHKTGDLDPLYHDGGIIMSPNRRYILSVFTNIGDPKVVAHISDLIYSKNLNLVGVDEKPSSLSEALPDQSVDPLVAQGGSSQVLAAITAPTPGITAADLGITASDLSSPISSQNLPKVIIPADSRLHFLVNAFQAVRRFVSIAPDARTQASIDEVSLKISEATDLKSKGKTTEANTLLKDAQNNIIEIAKEKAVSNDAPAQTALQSVSDTRFSVLGDELKSSGTTDRIKLIKEIAQEAKVQVTKVQPLIPQASNAVNPAQKPLLGEVVGSSDKSIQVRTAGGQVIDIPNETVKIKDAAKPTVAPTSLTPLGPQPVATATATPSTTTVSSLTSVKKGTTVALIGSMKGNIFVPTLVLKNVSKELLAPQPVVVLKVNVTNKTLVVSENGVPVQVNLTNKAVIKGPDTNVSLSSVKAGDIIVVHPETPKSTPAPTVSGVSPSIVPGASSSTPPSASVILKSQPSNQGTAGNPSGGQTNSPNTSGQSKNQPNNSTQTSQKAQAGQVNSPVSKPSQPTVIQSSSVQVIEKKQDVSKPAPSKPSAPSKPAPKKEENRGRH